MNDIAPLPDEFVPFSTKCKFCGLELHLQIDASYARENDPLKIIPLAACDHCADLRVRRRSLHDSFVKVCNSVGFTNDRDKLREPLEALIRKYLILIADWLGKPVVAFEGCMTEPFVTRPEHCSTHLRRLWRMSDFQAR